MTENVETDQIKLWKLEETLYEKPVDNTIKLLKKVKKFLYCNSYSWTVFLWDESAEYRIGMEWKFWRKSG